MRFAHPFLTLLLASALLAPTTDAKPLATRRTTASHRLPSEVPQLKTHQTSSGALTTFTLKNGLQVILKENRAAPVVSWVVTYKVGSRNEPVGATGSAHLLEHMLFKGTKTLGKGQIAQLLGRNGADMNASTWTDWTNYYQTYASHRLELGLMVEAARMRDALILDSERQSEMTVVRNELERGESSPSRMLYQQLTSTAYRSHPYSHPVIGWRSDVENVPTRELKRFYDTYYQPNNAVAVLVGDFDTQEAARMIAKYFSHFAPGKTPPAVHTTEEPQDGERRFEIRRRGETNLLQMAWHIPAVSHPDIAPMLVLDAILSTGVTGRLYQALVEKEKALSAWSDVGLQRDPSLFRLGASLKPGASHADVEAALLAEVETLKTTPVAEAELSKAKAQARAANVYENEGTTGLAKSLGYFAAIDTWERNFTLLEEMERTTAADIQRVAQKYLVPHQRSVGWYVATADGPLPPRPKNLGGGTATANEGRVKAAPLFDFEKRPSAARTLTTPVRKVLKNGLNVIVLENPGSQSVALSGHLWAGQLHEPAKKDGVAAAVAALLDTGTAKRSKLQLAGDLERISASLSYSGGGHLTDISGKALAGDLDTLLTALAETLKAPTFPDEELKKLKTRWIASLKQAEDQPGTRVERAFGQAIYPEGHPYRPKQPEVRVAAIEGLQRADLLNFHREFYGPNTTTLVLAGRVKASEVFQKLENLFADWHPATLRKPVVRPATPEKPGRIVVSMPDKTNVEVRIGHATPLTRHQKDYHAAQLGNYILGGDPLSSRLGMRLRDELGLTYGTFSVLRGGHGPGPWWASLTVNPANLAQGLTELNTVVHRLIQAGVTDEELTFAKSAFVGSQAVGLATNEGMAASLDVIAQHELGLDYWGRYPGLIEGVKKQAVNAALRRYVRPNAAHTILVGPLPEDPTR
ncbi:MAG: pitrilysin family protein [Candidatus Sericytochromatia bacterium]|nr:pitrilysin family protein [Candidatus Sericytochromatia bacterium]